MGVRSKPRSRKVAALILGMLMFGGAFAYAEDPDALTIVESVLMPTNRLSVYGNGPTDFQSSWGDDAKIRTGWEMQESTDPNAADEDWNPVIKPQVKDTQILSNPPLKAPNLVGGGGTPNVAFSMNITPADETVHYFRIRAHIPSGTNQLLVGSWSPLDPAIAGPMPPTNFASTLVLNKPELTWTNNFGADSLIVSNEIYRALPFQGFLKIATLPSSATTYTDLTAPANSLIKYQVVAVREKIVSNIYGLERSSSLGKPAVLSVTTAPFAVPATPIGLSGVLTHVTPTQDKVDLSWSDPPNDHDGYYLEWSPDGVTYNSSVVIPNPSTTTYSQLVGPDTRRYYRVRAFRNSDGQVSPPSNVVSINSIPSAPTNLHKVASSNVEVDLEWNDNSTTEDGFLVQYCNGMCTPSSSWSTLGTSGVDENGFPDTTVTGNLTRSWRVRAFNVSGNSPWSNIFTTTTPTAPLSAPISVTAIGVDSRHIQVSWTDTTINEDGFRIEYASTGAGPWTILNTVGANLTTYNDGYTLNPAEQRCYRVRSFRYSNGSSDASNIACGVTASPDLPNAPINLTATPLSGTQIKLDWTDTATNETGFKVERSTDGVSWVLAATINNINVTTYTNGGLLPSRNYTYRVRAFNADGNGPYSNLATAQTPGPPVPVWVNPSHNEQVAIRSCTVDGTASLADGVTQVAVYLTNTKNGQTTAAPLATVNGSGHWTATVNVQLAGTYNLSAYAKAGSIYSGAAKIFNWIVPADSLGC